MILTSHSLPVWLPNYFKMQNRIIESILSMLMIVLLRARYSSMNERRVNIGHLFIMRTLVRIILGLLLWISGSLTHIKNEYNIVTWIICVIGDNLFDMLAIPSSRSQLQIMMFIFMICGFGYFNFSLWIILYFLVLTIFVVSMKKILIVIFFIVLGLHLLKLLVTSGLHSDMMQESHLQYWRLLFPLEPIMLGRLSSI